MSVGHAHDPKKDHLEELAKLEKQAWFRKGRAIKYVIDHSHRIYYLGGSSNDGSKVYVDEEQYPKIKKLGLLEGLIEHEVVEGILLRSKKYDYAGAHELASAAEDKVYREQGLDPKKAQAKYPKLIKASEAEPIENVPSDLRLDPYSGELRKKMKAGMKPIGKRDLASMKRSLELS